MRVLGIDPGLATLGYGVVDTAPKPNKLKPFTSITYGFISTPKDTPIGERLTHIQRELRVLLRLYKPDVVCVETIFFFRNQKTIIQIGQVHGVLALTFHQARVPLHRYAPLQIKNVLTGNGKAEKKHIEIAVKKILGIKTKIRPDDAADGLAVALCHFMLPGVQLKRDQLKKDITKAKLERAQLRKTKVEKKLTFGKK